MADDNVSKKIKADSKIEKLEDRIAPGGIGGLVGDLGIEPNSGHETAPADQGAPPVDAPKTPSQEATSAANPGTTPAVELVDPSSEFGSTTTIHSDGAVDTQHSDGSGSMVYSDGTTETWNGYGVGSWDDGQGNIQNWNADESGTWSTSDGSRGYQNANGSGGFSNVDGSKGTYCSDGSSFHTESDGTAYQQNADGSGSVIYPHGTVENWDTTGSSLGEGTSGNESTGGDPLKGEPGTTTHEDGTVEKWNEDGSGSMIYPNGVTETWDGHGGGTWDDSHGSARTWSDYGSGTWTAADGSCGYQNADGSGGYNNVNGSYGIYNGNGSGSHTDADGTVWTFHSEGSGTVIYPDGTIESWAVSGKDGIHDGIAGEYEHEGSAGEGLEGREETVEETDVSITSVVPPDPNGDVSEFILPLIEGGSDPVEWGLDYDADGPVSWALPIDMSDVDLANSTFIISGDLLGNCEGSTPPEAVGPDEFGNYIIQAWEIAEVIDNGDGTVTLIFAYRV